MAHYLFCFGYETPDEWQINHRDGSDLESSNGVWVEAVSKEAAVAAGLGFAEAFVDDLFHKAGQDGYPGWRASGFAYWIEEEPLRRWSGLALESMPRIRAGDDGVE